MVKLRESTKSDVIQAMVVVAVFLAGIGLIIYLSYPDNMLAAVILVLGCLLFLVRWHARTFGYRCANCGEDFAIPTWKDFFALSGFNRNGSWKYLKCPNCGKRTKARELTRVG